MWQGSYGKEPFDLRLTVLRMICNIHIITAVTVLGMLIFGGGYYVKNVLLRDRTQYVASSTYRVEYAVEEEKDLGTVYINQVSWNTYVQSQMFLDAVQTHLMENNVPDDGSRLEMSDEELAETLEAFLASDLRVPSTAVTTDNPGKSVLIAQAVEAAMTGEFAESIREILSIKVIDPGDTAQEVVPDVRVGRAFALSAVLSCFFAVVVFLLKEIGDDSIRLPSSLWKRYGLKTLGTEKSKELSENIKYFFRGKGKVAVCPVQESIDPAEVLEGLRQSCPGIVTADWFPTPAPLLCPEVCEKLRRAQGILLAVQAGAHAGRQLERVLEYLEQQDCKITAAILTDADENLIKWYYFGNSKIKEL